MSTSSTGADASIPSAAKTPQIPPQTGHEKERQPEKDFFEFPPEVRNLIYERTLISDSPIAPGIRSRLTRSAPDLSLGLLQIHNRALHMEAASFFYSTAAFDFTSWFLPVNQAGALAFIELFAHENAARIRHLKIPFPTLHAPQPGRLVVDTACLYRLTAVGWHCPNLRRLTLLFSTDGNAMEGPVKDAFRQDYSTARRAVLQVFKVLKKATAAEVEVQVLDDDVPSFLVMSGMRRKGWEVRMVAA